MVKKTMYIWMRWCYDDNKFEQQPKQYIQKMVRDHTYMNTRGYIISNSMSINRQYLADFPIDTLTLSFPWGQLFHNAVF